MSEEHNAENSAVMAKLSSLYTMRIATVVGSRRVGH